MLRTHEDSGIYIYPSYVKGETVPEYIGHADATQFDLRAGHAILFVLLSKPTPEELKQIKYRKMEARLTCLTDILWLTFKFGNLDYMDAPFTPHLVKSIQLPEDLNGACDILQIVVVDTSNGCVCALRAIKLSEAFSAALRVGCLCLLPQDFNIEVYDALLTSVLSKYSATDIANAATVVFKASEENECRVTSRAPNNT